MELRVIRSETDYRAALASAGGLLDAPEGSSDAERLAVLAVLIEAYEREHYPLRKPTAAEAITFRMEQAGLTRKDLEPYIGSRARVSEVLSGVRALTLPMIRRLHVGLGIPLDALISDDSAPRARASRVAKAISRATTRTVPRTSKSGSGVVRAGAMRLEKGNENTKRSAPRR